MSKQISIYLFSAVLICSGQTLAQEPQNSSQADGANQGFALFEDIDTAQNRARGSSRAARESRATASEPEFTLLGTSRIGNSYSAILRHRSGESILVKSRANAATAIEDHVGYSVLSVGAGKLSLRYPANVNCVEHVQQGVSCAGSPNTAELVLARGEPLARSNAQQQPEQAESTEPVEPQAAAVANPFEALRGARADGNNPTQDNSVRSNRFAPRRISPEDVPPGMRVVSTPFGDRLVEQ